MAVDRLKQAPVIVDLASLIPISPFEVWSSFSMEFWWDFQEFIVFGFEHLGAKLGALILSVLYCESYEFAFAAFLVRPRKHLMIMFSLAPPAAESSRL